MYNIRTRYKILFTLLLFSVMFFSIIISLLFSQKYLYILHFLISFFFVTQILLLIYISKHLPLLSLRRFKRTTILQHSIGAYEQKYRTILDLMPELILIVDTDGKIVMCNKRASDYFDTKVMSTDQNALDFILTQSDREAFRKLIEVVKNEKIMHRIECTMYKKDSDLFEADICLFLLTDSDEKSDLLIIINDISELKNEKKENAKREEQNRAIHKMEAIGQLAGGIAHDFNNILGAISGYADIIQNLYNKDEKITKYTKMIISAASRASELTGKLLTFSRKKRMQMLAFDVHTILSEIQNSLRDLLDNRFIIEFNFMAENSIIIGDVSQFQNAITNLLLNSQDAMPDGGVIKIETSNLLIDDLFSIKRDYSVTPGSYISIQVSDTGEGIDKQLLDHVFEPFFTTKDSGKGTGLGLASVYGTVKSHQGYIDVKSEEGHGTTFTIYIPVYVRKDIIDCKQNAIEQPNANHILLIDDEKHALDEAVEIISWLGYRVSIVHNCHDALIIMNEQNVDLIIIDIVVLYSNGRDCLERIRRINNTVKVLLSVGSIDYGKKQELLKDGFAGEIQKPFISSQIVQAINNTLNSHLRQTIKS